MRRASARISWQTPRVAKGWLIPGCRLFSLHRFACLWPWAVLRDSGMVGPSPGQALLFIKLPLVLLLTQLRVSYPSPSSWQAAKGPVKPQRQAVGPNAKDSCLCPRVRGSDICGAGGVAGVSLTLPLPHPGICPGVSTHPQQDSPSPTGCRPCAYLGLHGPPTWPAAPHPF